MPADEPHDLTRHLQAPVAKTAVEGRVDRVALDAVELAPNARREISRDGIRLTGMLMRTGQRHRG